MMGIELVSAVDMTVPVPKGEVQAGYGVSLTDLGQFEAALHSTQMRLEIQPVHAPSQALQSLAKPLELVDMQAASLSEQAQASQANGIAMTPGEMVMLSVRCQEFMFHCQLTSNLANRASDGVQQLFRQQS
jgi:hypothetical protein